VPRFRYEALNPDGVLFDGTVTAGNERAAARSVEKRGLSLVSMRDDSAAAPRFAFRRARLRTGDIILALQELATMLLSEVPIADAVASQARSAHHPRIVEAFEGMARGLQRGESFSATLAASGLVLPPYVGQLARAGEMTGELGRALQDASAQMEYEQKLRVEMRNALIYPSVLVVAGVAAVALMFLFVVPKFASLLARAEDLPLLAWAVLALGSWANSHALWLAGAVAVVGGMLVWAMRRPEWRDHGLDRLSALPLVGTWLVEADVARWAKVLAALLANRVPLMRALELAQAGLQLPHRRARMGEVTRAVRGGASLAEALESQEALTATGYNLVRVGERSGKLPQMLASLARLYDEAGRTRMKRLLILIEPMAILLIGGVIGTIILGVILAITSANDLAI
jgi:general secretion pathway protein F